MDATAMRRHLEAHHQDGFLWAVSCCRGDREAARDVLQTVYLKVLEGRAAYRLGTPFKVWFFAVIRYTAADAYRARRRRRNREVGVAAPEAPAPPRPAADVHRRQVEDLLGDLLGRLSERQQEVLRLVFYHELTVDAAALVMGVSAGTARRHYARGKDRLRALIHEHDLADELL